ncbi:hypothetical protein [Chiayiivirga flava]|uniref:Uncharacterized protein n=1 Tax=Chiayiivirga flava TaxID=659595 RepID=A0A7W8D7G2_9GAMM|nr:hypothetical protein [Chiayiivirga flava]MBB5207678.1 hypothetical protein [Chiayiivirga flava]
MTPHDAHPTIRHLYLADDPGDLRCRAYLAALPEVDPPAALLERLRQARAAPAQRARWPWLASAAALAIAVLATQLLPQPHPAAPLASKSPEAPAVPDTPQDPASRASLLRLDAQLARAYEHDADDARLDALWQARGDLVDSLATAAPAELVQL